MRVTLFTSVAVLVITTGCGSEAPRPKIVMSQRLDQPPVLAHADHTGVYLLTWQGETSGRPAEVPHTAAFIRKGETLGFRADDAGAKVAVAGENVTSLAALPREARLVAWTRSPVSKASAPQSKERKEGRLQHESPVAAPADLLEHPWDSDVRGKHGGALDNVPGTSPQEATP